MSDASAAAAVQPAPPVTTAPIAPSEPVAAPPVAVEPQAPAAAPAAPESGAQVAQPESSPAPSADASVAPAEGAPDATPAVPAEPELKPHTDEPGLLTTQAEALKSEEEAKPAETSAEAPPAAPEPAAPEPLKYEPLTLPEGITLDNERLAKFDELVGVAQVPAETRQALADMHIAEMQQYAAHLRQEQHNVWSETRRQWRNEIMADPELGGAGFQTNLAAAQRMLQMFVPEQQRAAMDQALITTGMADHPAFFRLMVNLARFYDEPAPIATPQKPPADIGRRPNGAAARRADWYDHPRSTGG